MILCVSIVQCIQSNMGAEEASSKVAPATAETPAQKPQPQYFLYTCKYAYDPLTDSASENPHAELALQTGDYLFVEARQVEDERGFLAGELANGRRGLVPSNLVERVHLDAASGGSGNSYEKTLATLPATLLANPKFNDSLVASHKLDTGKLILAAQQAFAKLQHQQQQQQQEQQQQQQASARADFIDQVLMSPVATGAMGGSAARASYPINLRVEKLSETSVAVSWQSPTAPLSLNDIYGCTASSSTSTSSTHVSQMGVQKYQFYLNHQLHKVISGDQELRITLDNIQLNIVIASS